MRFVLLSVIILLCRVLLAQQSPLETISIEQGLSQGFVPSIAQDDDGFMWFATKNGLNRYDGYHFKVFRNDPFDRHSLNNDEISEMVQNGGFLFLVTNDDSPMLFHRKTQKFFEIDALPGISNGVVNTYTIKIPNSLVIYHANYNTTELFYFSWPENLDSTITANPAIENIDSFTTIRNWPIPENYRFVNVAKNENSVWFITGKTLVEQKIETGQQSYIQLPIENAKLYSDWMQKTYSIFTYRGYTWFLTAKKIIRYKNNGWENFDYNEPSIANITFDQSTGAFWYISGKVVYNIDLTQEPLNLKPLFSLDVEKIARSVFLDHTGILWIGTDAFGVRKFNPISGIFKNYLEGYSIGSRPLYNGEDFILMTEVRSGRVYRLLLNTETGDVKDITDLIEGEFISTFIPAMLNGKFWWYEDSFSESKIILVEFDPKTLQRKVFEMPEDLLSNVFAVFADTANNQIWLISNNGIVRFNIDDERFSIWRLNHEPAQWPVAIERDRDGNFWLGTRDNGIIKFMYSQGSWEYKRLVAEKGNLNNLPTNAIKSLLFDPADPAILWIGTNGKGLCRYDTETGNFSFFSERNGTLPDDVVYGILADDETPRNLWLSTNKGLTRFNPESGFLQHFTSADGLQENEFNTFASFKSSDGRMLFGGINGLTVFNPKDLNVDEAPPNLWFTNITVNGHALNPRDSGSIIKKDIAYMDAITLPHTKNNLGFDFALMDFSSPERNSFTYYLEGAEKPWVHRGFDHSAQYLNLSPGHYTFWVQGTNSNGIKTEKPISLEIVIRAPWYFTWPAFVIYGVLFLLLGFLINQYQLKQRLKSAEARRLKNLDEFKSRFYTNITHEFRTPLTVILGVTDQMISKLKDHSHPLSLIKRNAQNLLYLINQILDLTKLETHELQVHYIQGDILAFLKYISESLHSLANAQNVMLRVESNQASIIMDYDPERLRQIIHNLLSNAIKFTPSGGRVTLNARLINKELEIAVADNGIGIPAEEQPYLFDRFFQAGSHGTEASKKFLEKALNLGGSGIGLSLTKELIQIMGGTIRMESPRPDGNSGTVFTVTLPVTNKATMESKSLQANAYTNRLPATGKEIQPDTSLKILLVEDNPDVMEYLASCLSDKYHLEFAYNGRVGIEAALEHIPDLIISDVMMPEKDGLEVCDFLKNDERTSHIPIILLTARTTLQARLAGLRRGADVYLDKPFHEEELLVWIDQLIERQQRLIARYANLNIEPTAEISEAQPEALEMEDAFVRKFKKILEENYSNPEFSGNDITEKIGMSRAQLYRKLKSLTGKTVSAHLNTIRLEHAMILLRQGKLNVSEVAYQVGYNDPKYFGRLFSETYGQSPGEFAAKS